MSIKISKCETCKKCTTLDEAPWVACSKYPKYIPGDIYSNTIDSNIPVDCDQYECDPNWNK